MKKVILEHATISMEMVEKFSAMRNVLSLSCVVADAQERDNVMNSYMKMRTINKKIIGPALTVKLDTGDLVDCLDIFLVAKPGDVIVVDAFGETETSIWGGLMSGLCKAAGIEGAIVDGAIRDTDESKMLEFPVVSKSVVPRSTHSPNSQRMEPIRINTPIVCAGVIVKPGDLIIADEIGVTVVQQENWEEVYIKAKQQAEREEETRAEILKGKTIDELLQKFGRL
jgi:3-hexulose-6-phosphate synthase/6-phospho-3-hexuloisomerase